MDPKLPLYNHPRFSIAVLSFERHVHHLVDNLKSINKFAQGFEEIILVWDDFLQNIPVDFNQIRNESGCNFRLVLHSELYPWSQNIVEWGWIKQQLVKLLCLTYSHTPYTWIIDGDTLIVKPVELFSNSGKPFLHRTQEAIKESNGYYDFMRRFLKLEPQPTVLANGGGNCVFDHLVLQSLFNYCLEINNMSLIDCLQSIINPGGPDNNTDNLFPFSEFETYANFACEFFPDRFEFAPPNWSKKYLGNQKNLEDVNPILV